jgi:hypothetical protein
VAVERVDGQQTLAHVQNTLHTRIAGTPPLRRSGASAGQARRTRCVPEQDASQTAGSPPCHRTRSADAASPQCASCWCLRR